MSRFYTHLRWLHCRLPNGETSILSSLHYAYLYGAAVHVDNQLVMRTLITENAAYWTSSQLNAPMRTANFVPTADWIINSRRIYEDIIFHQLGKIPDEVNDYVKMFKYWLLKEGNPNETDFMICSLH